MLVTHILCARDRQTHRTQEGTRCLSLQRDPGIQKSQRQEALRRQRPSRAPALLVGEGQDRPGSRPHPGLSQRRPLVQSYVSALSACSVTPPQGPQTGGLSTDPVQGPLSPQSTADTLPGARRGLGRFHLTPSPQIWTPPSWGSWRTPGPGAPRCREAPT